MIALYVIGIYWGIPFVVSTLFVLWLNLVSRDIRLEGFVLLWGFIPVSRFRLISRKSWYARAWERWYGQALWLTMIHKDKPGTEDDAYVEETIVHELRHVAQGVVLGVLHPIIYASEYARLALFTDRDPYRDNVFERDARAAAQSWVLRGRPRIFNFGRRR